MNDTGTGTNSVKWYEHHAFITLLKITPASSHCTKVLGQIPYYNHAVEQAVEKPRDRRVPWLIQVSITHHASVNGSVHPLFECGE